MSTIVMIIIIITTHKDKFFKNSFNLEFDSKKAGSTKIRIPTIYITGKILSIIF